MFLKKLVKCVLANNSIQYRLQGVVCPLISHIELSFIRLSSNAPDPESKELQRHTSFENVENKNKGTYLDMIRIFVNRNNIYRRGHVEFIYSALKNMESFGVQKDLEVYKALIEVLPKGKFIPTNVFQVEFMHYPKQQQCIIDLLEQMEDNGVMPDYEMEDLLSNIFGNRGFPLRKYWRMMYWMPKFKNSSPWPVPTPIPDDIFELAKYAIQRISSVDVQSQVTVYQTKEIENSIDDTWIVGTQSPSQKDLLKNHDLNEPLYVEGSFRIWVKDRQVNYFILKRQPQPHTKINEDLDDVSNIKIPIFSFQKPVEKRVQIIRSVHEQEDGVILAVCATGTSSKDSLLSWIRHLEKDDNPILADALVVFTLRTGSREVATVDNLEQKQIENK